MSISFQARKPYISGSQWLPGNSGFTLVELMIVLAIAALLVIAAGPSYRAFVSSQRLDTAVNSYSLALRQARSEAIKSNGNVHLCAPNASGSDCATGSSASLSDGWLVVRQIGTDTTVLADSRGDVKGLQISTQTPKITFNRLGNPDPASAAIKFCANFFTDGKQVTLNAGGQPRQAPASCQ